MTVGCLAVKGYKVNLSLLIYFDDIDYTPFINTLLLTIPVYEVIPNLLLQLSTTDNEDVQKLTSLLVKLTSCKDDAQQRSWHLHDDEGTVNEMLTQTMDLLVSKC